MFSFLETICLYVFRYRYKDTDIESVSLSNISNLGCVIFAPMGCLTSPEAFLVIICRLVLLASSGWRPGMLLMSCTGETTFPPKSYSQDVRSAEA